MLVIESQKLWCELKYDDEVTEKELLDSIKDICNYIKENPKEVTHLLNRYSMRKNVLITINLFNLGYEKAKFYR